MTSPVLVRAFARVSEAPTSMPALRKLIFDLAAHGRLLTPSTANTSALTSELAPALSPGRARASLKPISLPRGVPTGWRYLSLTDLARVTYGYAFPSSHFNETKSGMPLIRIRDIDALDTQVYYDGEWDPDYIVRAGDYLVGMDGDFNLRRWKGCDALLNQRVMRLNSWNQVAIPEFVTIGLQIVLDRLHETTSQTTVKHLSAQQVRSIRIPIPPTMDQERIVTKVRELKVLCDDLELAQQAREETRDACATAALGAVEAAVSDHLNGDRVLRERLRFFTDNMHRLVTRSDHLVEVRRTILQLAMSGRLVPQDPTDIPAQDLLTSPSSLPNGYQRRRKILRSELSEAPTLPTAPIPATWTWRTVHALYELNAIVDYADGNHGSLYPRTSEFGDSGVLFATARNLSRGRVNWKSCALLSKDRAAQLTKGWAQGGDVLLTHNATVGRVALVEPEAGRFLLGTSVTYYRLDPRVLLNRFVYRVFESPIWQDQMRAIMAQTTRNQVSIQKQALFYVPVPPLAEQARIALMVDQLMTICDELALSVASCRSGRLDVLHAALVEYLVGHDSER